MGSYRDDLEAAHQRIAALEGELRDKKAEPAQPEGKKGRRKNKGVSEPAPSAPSSSPSPSPPPKGFLARHPEKSAKLFTVAVAFAHLGAALLVFPHDTQGIVAAFGSLLSLAASAVLLFRGARSAIDPKFQFMTRGEQGMEWTKYSRNFAVGMLVTGLAIELAAVLVPAVRLASREAHAAVHRTRPSPSPVATNAARARAEAGPRV